METSGDLAEAKLKAEIAKIEAETAAINKPWFQQSSFTNILVSLLVPIFTILIGYYLGGGKEFFDAEKRNLEADRKILEYDIQTDKEKSESLKKALSAITSRYDSIDKQNRLAKQELDSTHRHLTSMRKEATQTRQKLDKLRNDLKFLNSPKIKVTVKQEKEHLYLNASNIGTGRATLTAIVLTYQKETYNILIKSELESLRNKKFRSQDFNDSYFVMPSGFLRSEVPSGVTRNLLHISSEKFSSRIPLKVFEIQVLLKYKSDDTKTFQTDSTLTIDLTKIPENP